jgi:hypothetical protein
LISGLLDSPLQIKAGPEFRKELSDLSTTDCSITMLLVSNKDIISTFPRGNLISVYILMHKKATSEKGLFIYDSSQ